MASSFSFRQRIGKLDWKLVSSVSTEDIILNLKISELQAILDPVTFCEFGPADVKNNTVESTSKLVQLMQLISEYLLHCQETQFKLIKELNSKVGRYKSSNEKLKLENIALKEDNKICLRQMAMLRKSLSNTSNGVHNRNDKPIIQYQESRSNTSGTPELIGSLLQNERETRAFLLSLMEDQRRVFSEELSTLTAGLKERLATAEKNEQQNQSRISDTSSVERTMEAFRNQMEGICEAAIEKANKQVRSSRQDLAASTATTNSANSSRAEDILRSSALETLERDLTKRQTTLQLKEKSLRDRETAVERRERETRDLENDRKTWVDHRDRDATSIPLQTKGKTSLMLVKSSKVFAARSVLSRIHQALWRKRMRAFHHWLQATHSERERLAMDEQARVLTAAAQKLSRREAELSSALESERNSLFIATTRVKNLTRDLEACREQMSQPPTIINTQAAQSQREADLASQLKTEKERAVLATARLSTLTARNEKEKRDLIERLQEAEEEAVELRIQQQSAGVTASSSEGSGKSRSIHNSSSVMTSTDYSSITSPPPPVKTTTTKSSSSSTFKKPSQVLPSLFSPFLSMTPEEMVERASKRVTEKKNNKEELESQAMTSLAKEIQNKLHHESE